MVKKASKKNLNKKSLSRSSHTTRRLGDLPAAPKKPAAQRAPHRGRFLSLDGFENFLAQNPQIPLTAYLAPEGFEELTLSCLRDILFTDHQLIICLGPEQLCPWAQEVFPKVDVYPIVSIADAAQRLKQYKIPWVAYSPRLFRRSELILDQAQTKKQRNLFQSEMEFPPVNNNYPIADRPKFGTIYLIKEDLMMVAEKGSRPYPLGIANFKQFKVGPPSRAYLKLFEALTYAGSWPQKNETCLEIGAAPGGWTWVLRNLGAKVITYDRAPLDPHLMADPTISHRLKDAFQATPDRLPELVDQITWIFSDIICYPDKLLSWIKTWQKARPNINFVCTIKFQGDAHYGVIPELRGIPGSKLVHLHHNKHELTWIYTR
jgi:23S rRNA (cytidine2498-2'-O)-methyltransferase